MYTEESMVEIQNNNPIGVYQPTFKLKPLMVISSLIFEHLRNHLPLFGKGNIFRSLSVYMTDASIYKCRQQKSMKPFSINFEI